MWRNRDSITLHVGIRASLLAGMMRGSGRDEAGLELVVWWRKLEGSAIVKSLQRGSVGLKRQARLHRVRRLASLLVPHYKMLSSFYEAQY